jgi:hypothetical protein
MQNSSKKDPSSEFSNTKSANNSSGMNCCTYDCNQGRGCPIRSHFCKDFNSNTNIININYPGASSAGFQDQKFIFKNELALNLSLLLFTYGTTICITSFKFYDFLKYTLIILGMAVFAIYSSLNHKK